MATRFLLLFALARMLPAADFGLFGLASAATTFMAYLVGLDLYVYTTRELLSRESHPAAGLLRVQFSVAGIAFLVMTPIAIGVLIPGFLPPRFAVWLAAIILCEYVSQELYRLLITYSRPVAANVCLLIRTAAWAWLALMLLFFVESGRHIALVLYLWLLGSLLSVIAGAWFLRKHVGLRAILREPLRAPVAGEALRVGAKFFVASLSLRFLEFFDRFLLAHLKGKEVVAVYVWYWTLANAANVVLITAVISLWYPKLISSYEQGGEVEAESVYRDLRRSFLRWTVVALIMVAVGGQIATVLVGKAEYQGQTLLFSLLVVSAVLSAAIQLPQSKLYVRRRDWSISLCCVSGAVCSLILNILLIPSYGALGSATSYLVGTLLIGACYLLVLHKLARDKRLADRDTVQFSGR